MPIAIGAIVMWSGALIDIPQGWALCDGTNGTIDLRNRFVVGAGNTYSIGDTGGSADAVLVSHTHTNTISQDNNHSHSIGYVYDSGGSSLGGDQQSRAVNPITAGTSSAGAHTHTVTTTSEGQTATNANLPPYYALAFIQQVQ